MARSVINKTVNDHGIRHKDFVDIILFEMDKIQSKIKRQILEEIKRDCSASTWRRGNVSQIDIGDKLAPFNSIVTGHYLVILDIEKTHDIN